MTNREVEKLVAEWLAEEAPRHAPDRILSVASERIGHQSQRGDGTIAWLAGKRLQRAGAVRAATAGVVLIAVASLALYAGSAPPVNITPAPTYPLVAASPPETTPSVAPPTTPSNNPAPSVPPVNSPTEERATDCGNVTIRDETERYRDRGIVTGCTATGELPDGVLIEDMGMTRIVNPEGDQQRLHAVWLTSPCDTRAELSIRTSSYEPSASGEALVPRYEVAVYLPDVYAGCRDQVLTMGVILELSKPVAADLVTSWRGSANVTNDRITDLIVDATSYDAEASYRLGGIYSIDSAITSIGEGEMCGIEMAAIDVTRDRDRGIVLLGFGGLVTDPPSPIDQRTIVIPNGTYRILAPPDPPDIDISRLQRCEGWTITLHALTQSGRDDSDPTGATNFSLKIDAAQTEFAADQPIDVSATLEYQGHLGSTITVGGSGLLGFGIEQLDGDLEVSPLWPAMCSPSTLTVGEPLQARFFKSGGFSPGEPDAGFYRKYFEEPELRLPAGIWRVYASSSFVLGGDCRGDGINLTASITIRVR